MKLPGKARKIGALTEKKKEKKEEDRRREERRKDKRMREASVNINRLVFSFSFIFL
jgi:hypothetical protein